MGLFKVVSRKTVEVAGRIIVRVLDNDRPQSRPKVKFTYDHNVVVPSRIEKILMPIFENVCRDVECENRTGEEWIEIIESEIEQPEMRNWVASIAWWDYQADHRASPLLGIAEPLPQGEEYDENALCEALIKVGFPDPTDRLKQLGGQTRRSINKALKNLEPVRIKLKETKGK